MVDMAAIHIRDVPETVVVALRERADRHGHSMQQELRDILTDAANERPETEAVRPVRLVTVRTGGRSTWRREEIYGDQGR
jgi:plasmid stability protein